MRLLIAAATAASLLACSSTSAVIRVTDSRNLSLSEAQTVVTAFQERRAAAAASNDPLAQPKSLDDVTEILKRDELTLFPAGVAFASKDQSVKGKTLLAQIELAWGEAQHMLSDLLDRATYQLKNEHQSLTRRASSRALTEQETARLKALDDTLLDVAGVSEALTRLGDEHIGKGIEVAKGLIASAPDDYQGYRVAADYYRLRDEWPQFDATIAKLQALNPDSNGLVFARAMEALQRKNDRAKATELLGQALAKDPKFTRARAQLLLAQTGIDAAWSEFEKLKAESPNHQIVRWVGPALQAERESYEHEAIEGINTQLRFQSLDRGVR